MKDILLADLTTTTNNAILETNGMVYLSASCKGEALKLRENASFQIGFPPNNNNKPGMQLFSGAKDERGQIIWKPFQIESKIIERTEKDEMGFTKERDIKYPQFKGGIQALSAYLNKAYGYRYKEEEPGGVVVEFNVDERGYTCCYSLAETEPGVDHSSIVWVLQAMPKWEPGRVNGKLKKFRFKLPVIFKRWDQKKVHTYGFVGAPKPVDKNSVVEGSAELSFMADRLGWINCDRFIDNTTPRKQLYVNMPMNDLRVKAVFHNYRAVLPSYYSNGQYRFEGIPEGEPATIIAFREDASGMYLALKDVHIGQEQVIEMPLRKVTGAQLRATLEQFDALRPTTAMQ